MSVQMYITTSLSFKGPGIFLYAAFSNVFAGSLHGECQNRAYARTHFARREALCKLTLIALF